MVDESSRKLVNGGNDSESRKKKEKSKRVATESVTTVEEATLKHKKNRTEKKKETDDDQNIKERAHGYDAHQQLAASAKQVSSPLGTPNDSEIKPREKRKRKMMESDENAFVKKGKKRKQVPVDEELGNDAKDHGSTSTTTINTLEPTHDKKSQHQDDSTSKNVQKTETSKVVSTNLHQDMSHDDVHASEKSSKKKRKHRHEDGESAVNPDEPDNIDKKKQKRKEILSDAQAEAPEPKLKKNKKPRSSRQDSDNLFPDPNEDTNLTDSARRALTYVHAQISSHPDWKFNKARQNWVVRNMWDDNAVPDTYFPSCVKYLVSVRGNTREILLKESKSILDSSASRPNPKNTAIDKAKASEDDQGPGEVRSHEDQRVMRVKRAEMILVGLGHDPRRDQ